MLENGSKIKLDETFLRKKRKDAKSASVFKGFKNLYFLLGIIFGFLTLLILFFTSDYSNIYRITVNGNYYLSDEDVVSISEISESDKYFFTIPYFVSRKLNQSPYIESSEVIKKDDRVIEINVVEKKQIAYRSIGTYEEIIFVDGTSIEINSANAYLKRRLPELDGFTNEQLNEILRGFKNVNASTIDQISELHRYSFSYDKNMLEAIMKDGNICFVSWTGLSMLNKYYSIVSGLNAGNSCIYLDELTNSGYVSICPWQENWKNCFHFIEIIFKYHLDLFF